MKTNAPTMFDAQRVASAALQVAAEAAGRDFDVVLVAVARETDTDGSLAYAAQGTIPPDRMKPIRRELCPNVAI